MSGEPLTPALVSIITIFRDAERFLEEAIDSVLKQTYPHWELLLIDDGSNDGSTEIAQRFAIAHAPRVRYLAHPNHENRGMSASRNLGISRARGSLLAFLDADDVYLPRKLERQVDLLRAHPEAGMIYGRTLYWYSWTGSSGNANRDRLRTVGVPLDRICRPPNLLARIIADRARTPCTCGVLLRREVVDRVGGFEEEFKGMNEDQVFFSKVLRHSPVYVSGECLDRYRQHPDSHVQVFRRSDHRKPPVGGETQRLDEFAEWRRTYLSRPENDHPRLKRALRKTMRPTRSRFRIHLERMMAYAQRLQRRRAGR